MLILPMSGYGNQVEDAKKAATVAAKTAKSAEKVAEKATKEAAKMAATAKEAAENAAKKPEKKRATKKATAAIKAAEVAVAKMKAAKVTAIEAARRAREAAEAFEQVKADKITAIREAIKAEAYAKAADKASRKEIKRAKEAAEAAAQQILWKDRFNLKCPGGPDDYEKVVIEKALGKEFPFWHGSGVLGVIFKRYTMVHRVKNRHTNVTPDITNGADPVVTNLCKGGSVTLVESMENLSGGYYKRVIWTAEGDIDDDHDGVYDRIGFDESSPGILRRGWHNSEEEAKRPTWVINFTDITSEF